MSGENQVSEKGWEEFRQTGLLLIINQILHIFGWAIVIEMVDDDPKNIIAYPARVKFRGFGEASVEKAYRKVSQFMLDNAKELKEEADS